MFRNGFYWLRHFCFRLLGIFLAQIRLHRVEFISIDGVERVRKRRHWIAGLIIPPGNVFLSITGSPMIVLPSVRWFEWEHAVENATCRNLVLDSLMDRNHQRTGLICRRVSGIPLSQFLASSAYSYEQKFNALSWSLESLRTLHQCVADWGNGIHQSISHGDATANNVIVDVSNKTACWIDFDTRHRPEISEADRRADDLRTVIYSAAANIPLSSFPKIADVIAAVQFDEATVESFRDRLANESDSLTVTQFAQAPLPWSTVSALRRSLQDSLNFFL